MNFLVGNAARGQILEHSHHHASQVTIGLASTAYSREDFFHRTEKLDLSIWKNSVYSPVSRKTGSNRRQMLINARKAGRRPIFAAFLTFSGKFCPKKFVWWEFSPCHLFAITLAFRPFFTLGIPFFYAFKCAATKREGGVEELLRGQWKTLWRRQKVGARAQKAATECAQVLTGCEHHLQPKEGKFGVCVWGGGQMGYEMKKTETLGKTSPKWLLRSIAPPHS